MTAAVRVLLTGFGPFPGAPYNPTPALIARLAARRRPAFAGIDRLTHVFPVTYRAVDAELPALIAQHRPHALLMFGLAARTPYVRVEGRARNAITTLWPDASHAQVRRGTIVPGADFRTFGPHSRLLLRAAQRTRIDVRASRDAGRYLCNYLCFRAIEATQKPAGPLLANFVHIPLMPRPGAQRIVPNCLSFDELAVAGEAMLLETIRLARICIRTAYSGL